MEKEGSIPCMLGSRFSRFFRSLCICRQTAIYAQGVGLGASKGRDIESLSNSGYSSYNNVHEVARERYNDTS